MIYFQQGVQPQSGLNISLRVTPVSTNGSHLHISLSDSTGKTIGGHLMEGCKSYTTADIVILRSNDFVFKKENDGTTPWVELHIEIKNT